LNRLNSGPPNKRKQPYSKWGKVEVDQIEVGRRISGQFRFALQVDDLEAAVQRLLAKGVLMVHPPVVTPWGDYNVRMQDPDGLQVTLFQTVGNREA
jgi:uncharacterized glyoxalase superfamily protein PhnB